MERDILTLANEATATEEVDEDDLDQRRPTTVNMMPGAGLTLAAKLGLRYIKRQIEEKFNFNEPEEWIKTSNKVTVLMSLLKDLKCNGHKVLIFSKTKIFLNLIERLVSNC